MNNISSFKSKSVNLLNQYTFKIDLSISYYGEILNRSKIVQKKLYWVVKHKFLSQSLILSVSQKRNTCKRAKCCKHLFVLHNILPHVTHDDLMFSFILVYNCDSVFYYFVETVLIIE